MSSNAEEKEVKSYFKDHNQRIFVFSHIAYAGRTATGLRLIIGGDPDLDHWAMGDAEVDRFFEEYEAWLDHRHEREENRTYALESIDRHLDYLGGK